MASLIFSQKLRLSHLMILVCTALTYVVAIASKQGVAAGVYFFGDSLLDVGNNNLFSSPESRANFPHYGIDYPAAKPTGRFSNGKNAADFIAEKLGVPTAPPYLSDHKYEFVKGVNFASGGAGIFNTTNIGLSIPLPRQVEHFFEVHQGLVQELGHSQAHEHLSRSIFVIEIGTNDVVNYIKKSRPPSTKYLPKQYLNLAVTNLREMIKELYDLGAKNFLVFGMIPLGCSPRQRLSSPKYKCNRETNYWSKKYNTKLKQMFQDSASNLKEFHYTIFDTYNAFSRLIIKNQTTYGFGEIKAACCGSGKLRAELPCTPIAQCCSNRRATLFWDPFHPSEAALHIFMDILFNEANDYTYPMKVQQLMDI